MEKLLIPLLRHLWADWPVLLMYVAGIVLALWYRRRYPRPCAFTLIASVLFLLTRIGETAANLYVLREVGEADLSSEKLIWILKLITQFGSCLRALAYGLLLAAVFTNRGPRYGSPGY